MNHRCMLQKSCDNLSPGGRKIFKLPLILLDKLVINGFTVSGLPKTASYTLITLNYWPYS